MSLAPEHNPDHPRNILRPYLRPGLFVTATNTEIGKTTVTAALAAALRRLGVRVGVCKPIASGCLTYADRPAPEDLTNDDLSSPDAELIARAAGIDPTDSTLLPYLAPVRYAAPIAPHMAAKMEGRNTDWRRIATAFDYWAENCDVLLVEGAGGWLVALDQFDFTIADFASILRLPVLVVTNNLLGTLNLTALTVQAIRQRNLPVAGLVVNNVGDDLESNLTELPRFCGVPLRATFPKLPAAPSETNIIPNQLIDLITPFARKWWQITRPQAD